DRLQARARPDPLRRARGAGRRGPDRLGRHGRVRTRHRRSRRSAPLAAHGGGGNARDVSGLLRSNITVALGTALSRVTGLLRIMVFGWVIGQTALSDTYVIANETPNIVYDLLL